MLQTKPSGFVEDGRKTTAQRIVWASVTALPITLMVLGGCVSYSQLLSQETQSVWQSHSTTGDTTKMLDTNVVVSAFQLSVGLSLLLGHTFSLCAFTVNSGDMTLQLVLKQVLASVAQAGLQPEETKATTWVALRFTSCWIGLVFALLGWCRRSAVLSYLPYPVVAGFLAMVGTAIIKNAVDLLSQGEESRMPLLLGCGLAVSSQIAKCYGMHGNLAAVLAIVISIVGFWLWVAVSGQSTDELQSSGWLLPHAEATSMTASFTVADWRKVSWMHVLPDGSCLVLTIVACMNRALTTTGIEAACGESFSIDDELYRTGKATAFSGFVGGICMNPSSGMSSVCKEGCQSDRRMARYVVWISAAFFFCFFLSGVPLTNYLPNFLLGGLLMMMGVGMVVDWAWYVRKRIEKESLAIIYGMILFSLLTGLIQGVVLGIGIALLLVNQRFARLEVLKYHITGVHFRSPTVYTKEQRQLLAKYGHRTQVIGVTGFLFEGVAIYLSKYLREIVRIYEDVEDEYKLRTLIIDFFSCQGINDSACAHLMKVRVLCASHKIKIRLSNLDPEDRVLLEAWGFTDFPPAREKALAESESEILAEHKVPVEWKLTHGLGDDDLERVAHEALAAWLGQDAAQECLELNARLQVLQGTTITRLSKGRALNEDPKNPGRHVFLAIPSYSEVQLELLTGNKQRPAVLYQTKSGAVCGGEALIGQATRGTWRLLQDSLVLELPCAEEIKAAPTAFAALLAATLHQQIHQTDQFSTLYTVSRGGGWQGVTFDGMTSAGAKDLMTMLGKMTRPTTKKSKAELQDVVNVARSEDHVGDHLVAAVLTRKDSLGSMTPIMVEEISPTRLSYDRFRQSSISASNLAEELHLTLNRDSVSECLNLVAGVRPRKRHDRPLHELFGDDTDVEAPRVVQPGLLQRNQSIGCISVPVMTEDDGPRRAISFSLGALTDNPLAKALLTD